jgi:hypothetical protein
MGQMASNPGKNTVVFVLAQVKLRISIEASNTTTQKLNNVVVLKGKRKPNEYVVFSGHYDHLRGFSSRRTNMIPKIL